MSIGKRLIDLARSELNSLLDKAADYDERRELDDDSWGSDLSSLSDAELEAEIERRRRAREEAEEAISGKRPEASRADGPTRSSTRPSGGPRFDPPRRTASGDNAIRKAYAALEVQPGSDFETIRKSYRRLMRKYHPDLHRASPEAQRAATDLAQRLTEAYKLLEKHTRGK
jgi:DnaJ-domain-containing protein 1